MKYRFTITVDINKDNPYESKGIAHVILINGDSRAEALESFSKNFPLYDSHDIECKCENSEDVVNRVLRRNLEYLKGL